MIPIVEIQAKGETGKFSDETIIRYGYFSNTFGVDEFKASVVCSWSLWNGDDYLKDNVSIRHGFSEGKKSESIPCVVVDCKEVYDRRLKINMTGYNFGWKLNELSAKSFVFKNRTVSDMVSEISSTLGMSADVDSTTDKFDLIGSGYTVGQLIFNEMLPRAGSNYYCCFRPPNKLVFKKWDTIGDTKRFTSPELAKSPYFVYNRDVESTNWTSIGWDLSTDLPVIEKVDFNSSGAKGFASNGFEFKNPTSLKNVGSSTQKNNLKSYSKGLYTAKNLWMNNLVIPVYGDPELVPPFIVDMNINQDDNITRFTSGKYLAHSVGHIIEKSGDFGVMYVSYIICGRRGYG